MAEGLRTEVHGNVGVVIMDRPPHNFLNFRQIHDIADALEEMQNDMSIRCAVLAADGRSFCAGADFAGDGVGGGDDEVVGGDATLALYQGSGRLFDVTLPIVGAIQGPAVGGGLGLAMVPDIRITCPDARFSANFASLGIHQGFGMSVTLPQLLGPSRAAQVLYSAKRYKGEEAVAIGLADECVPSEQVRERALEVATEIAANAPLALRAIKSTLRLGLGDRVREITQREAQLQAELSASDDAKEGIAAVGERRAGNFKGK
ncbi:MAG: enoyl-CoA hydratase [Acidimicrobiaceae bacterium]|jgi:enoyl-CoA hydratase/carnithine racemase|nr:enoyl-CoA hydratase [Acidimicrobiaceae bacterium]MCH2627095.1 enoyl-CoA hydratase/isomerase family protein [Acidimicrobiales bacterium]MEC9088116.1 enoyl-CoA hydratase/isomerase family protein [Actinomycetota bacterium]MBR81123.1 enoyl-CoA hydratase [Acidimicrobiaceae bacterium]MEC9114831.1 enoyl-CoA hydratase/isomerase family protein [Actinomycetota bacterium]|tara:strand:- start:2744 stop:3526 length:783 start_codon:yes stop_codon:yes gene_type:complete